MRNNPIVVTVISLLTFPGIIIHELAHSIFCNITQVQVYKVCYFRLGNPSGFVIHEPADSYWKALLIDIAPFLINTLTSLLIFAIAINLSQSLIAYLFYFYGKNQKLSSAWILAIGFSLLALTYASWAPWHFSDLRYIYFIWFDIFLVSLAFILTGFFALPKEITSKFEREN